MAWPTLSKNDENRLPDRLRGKTPEQIAAELAELDKAKADAAKAAELETARAASDAERDKLKLEKTALENEFNQTKSRLAALEAHAARGGNGGAGGSGAAETPSVLDNEDAAFQSRLAPLQAGLLSVGAQQAKLMARQRIAGDSFEARLFGRYEKEVDEVFSKVPIGQQVFEQSYLYAFDIVKSRHMKEIIDEAKKSDGALTLGQGREQVEEQKPPEKLTLEEEANAKKMGVKPEDWLAARKKMKFTAA